MDGALLVVIPFKMQGMIPFKIQGVGYPNKLREIAYLWIVTCKDADCEMDQWSKRIDYNKYTKHYNKEYTINDSVKVCTKYAKALKSEIYDKKANVNNDADQKEDGM
eukprot:103840_1